MESAEHATWLVAGTGCVEELVSHRLDLPEPALEVLEWRKSVVVTQTEVLHGGVILTGFLRTRCMYAAPDRVTKAKGACTGRGVVLQEAWGRILFHWADVSFTSHMPVPGAAPGMDVAVTEAYVSGDASLSLEPDPNGLISHVVDRSLLVVRLRVLQSACERGRRGGRGPRKVREPGKERAPKEARVAAQARDRAAQQKEPDIPPRASLEADQAFRAMDIHTWVAASAVLACQKSC